jgi:poly(3-hydroxybutyrate) depolymerase
VTTEQPVMTTSAFFRRGKTTVFASQYDQRFSYCLYVPADPGPNAPLVVIQHGTERNFLLYRDHLQGFADEHGVVVLAPLLPAGVGDPADMHNFKFIDYQGIRYDKVLLSMVDEVAATCPVDAEKFYPHGFSGGGQFAHRFCYLHPIGSRVCPSARPAGSRSLMTAVPGGWGSRTSRSTSACRSTWPRCGAFRS